MTFESKNKNKNPGAEEKKYDRKQRKIYIL